MGEGLQPQRVLGGRAQLGSTWRREHAALLPLTRIIGINGDVHRQAALVPRVSTTMLIQTGQRCTQRRLSLCATAPPQREVARLLAFHCGCQGCSTSLLRRAGHDGGGGEAHGGREATIRPVCDVIGHSGSRGQRLTLASTPHRRFCRLVALESAARQQVCQPCL